MAILRVALFFETEAIVLLSYECMDDDNRRGKFAKIITRVQCRYTNPRSARVRNTFFSSDGFLDAKLGKILKFRIEIVPKMIAADIRDDRKTRLDDRVPFVFLFGRFTTVYNRVTRRRDFPLPFIIGNTLVGKPKKLFVNAYCGRAWQKATTHFAMTFSLAVPTAIVVGHTIRKI